MFEAINSALVEFDKGKLSEKDLSGVLHMLVEFAPDQKVQGPIDTITDEETDVDESWELFL